MRYGIAIDHYIMIRSFYRHTSTLVSVQKRVLREESKLLSMMPLTGTSKANRTLLDSIQKQVRSYHLRFTVRQSVNSHNPTLFKVQRTFPHAQFHIHRNSNKQTDATHCYKGLNQDGKLQFPWCFGHLNQKRTETLAFFLASVSVFVRLKAHSRQLYNDRWEKQLTTRTI